MLRGRLSNHLKAVVMVVIMVMLVVMVECVMRVEDGRDTRI